MSIYHAFFQSYGHENAKNGLFFIFSADDSTKLVTVLVKRSSVADRSSLVLSKNGNIMVILIDFQSY